MPVRSDFRLGRADPVPHILRNLRGASPLLVICEHGGRELPECVSDRAPSREDMGRHIAWDVGAAFVAGVLSDRLDAALAMQPYSRLVIDCNRPRHATDLVPPISDGSEIPFNRNAGAEEIEARWRLIHQPFHGAVDGLVRARAPVALAAIHSFTPRLRGGSRRPMAIGLLARRDLGLAEALREAIARHAPGEMVAMNAPYRIEDDSDYTIPVHAEARDLPHVLVEIRNDLIGHPDGAKRWGMLLAAAMADVLA